MQTDQIKNWSRKVISDVNDGVMCKAELVKALEIIMMKTVFDSNMVFLFS